MFDCLGYLFGAWDWLYCCSGRQLFIRKRYSAGTDGWLFRRSGGQFFAGLLHLCPPEGCLFRCSGGQLFDRPGDLFAVGQDILRIFGIAFFILVDRFRNL